MSLLGSGIAWEDFNYLIYSLVLVGWDDIF